MSPQNSLLVGFSVPVIHVYILLFVYYYCPALMGIAVVIDMGRQSATTAGDRASVEGAHLWRAPEGTSATTTTAPTTTAPTAANPTHVGCCCCGWWPCQLPSCNAITACRRPIHIPSCIATAPQQHGQSATAHTSGGRELLQRARSPAHARRIDGCRE